MSAELNTCQRAQEACTLGFLCFYLSSNVTGCILDLCTKWHIMRSDFSEVWLLQKRCIRILCACLKVTLVSWCWLKGGYICQKSAPLFCEILYKIRCFWPILHLGILWCLFLFVLTTCTIALVLDDAGIDTMTGPGSISRNCVVFQGFHSQ